MRIIFIKAKEKIRSLQVIKEGYGRTVRNGYTAHLAAKSPPPDTARSVSDAQMSLATAERQSVASGCNYIVISEADNAPPPPSPPRGGAKTSR